MNRTLCLATALTLITGPALAADLPSPKNTIDYAPLRPGFDWTGLYVGANGGFSGSDIPANLVLQQPVGFGAVTTSAANTSIGFGDFFLGAQAGYNFQFRNKFLVGLETDFQWKAVNTRINVNTSSLTFGPGFAVGSALAGSATFRRDWFGSTRARVGYAITDQFLTYVTGGVAYSAWRGSLQATSPAAGMGQSFIVNGAASDTKLGWTVGGGVEYAITSNISFKTEYLFSNFGGFSVPITQVFPNFMGFGPALAMGQLKINDISVHAVRSGLNWKFGGQSSPIYAGH